MFWSSLQSDTNFDLKYSVFDFSHSIIREQNEYLKNLT